MFVEGDYFVTTNSYFIGINFYPRVINACAVSLYNNMQSEWLNSSYLDLLDLDEPELESGNHHGVEIHDQEEPAFKPRPPSSTSTAFCLSPDAVQVTDEDYLTDPGYTIPSVSSATPPPATSPYPHTHSCPSVSPAPHPEFLNAEDLQLDSLGSMCFAAQLDNLHGSARFQEAPRQQETFSYAEGDCGGAEFRFLPPPPAYDAHGTFHPSSSCPTFSTYVADEEYRSCGYQTDRSDSFPNTPSSSASTNQGILQSTPLDVIPSTSFVPSTLPFLSSPLTPTVFTSTTTTDLSEMEQDTPNEQGVSAMSFSFNSLAHAATGAVYNTGGSMHGGVNEHVPPQLPLTPVLQNPPKQSENGPVLVPSTSRESPLPLPLTPTASAVAQPAPRQPQLGEPFVPSGPSMSAADSEMMLNLDPRLAKAAKECWATGKMTPMIKEELRLSILTRRHSRGQDEPQVTFSPPRKYELTPEEQEKKVKRKEMNRTAAKRHRSKKKMQATTLLVEYQELEKKNEELKARLSLLEAEKKTFLSIITLPP